MIQAGIFNLVISLKVPQFGFDEQKDMFYDSLINDVRKLKKKKIVIVVGDFIGYSESNTKDYVDQHWGYGYEVRNKRKERILEFCAAMNLTIGKKLFKKRAIHVATYGFNPSKTHKIISWEGEAEGIFWE